MYLHDDNVWRRNGFFFSKLCTPVRVNVNNVKFVSINGVHLNFFLLLFSQYLFFFFFKNNLDAGHSDYADCYGEKNQWWVGEKQR